MTIEALMTTREVCGYLHIHSSTLRRLLHLGFPGFRVGGDWRFRRDLIDAWRFSQPTTMEVR
jgi:excisionase family DNA binding protein